MGLAVSQTSAPDAADGVAVWDINWPSMLAFLDCETQWRVTSTMAGLHWTGLDYQGVDVVLRRTGAPEHVFADVQDMERAALAAFNEAD